MPKAQRHEAQGLPWELVFKLRLALKGLATGPMKSSVRQRAEMRGSIPNIAFVKRDIMPYRSRTNRLELTFSFATTVATLSVPAKCTIHVDVISNSTDADCWRTEVIRGRGEIPVEIFSDARIGKTGHPVLGRKDEMKKNSRRGLRHII